MCVQVVVQLRIAETTEKLFVNDDFIFPGGKFRRGFFYAPQITVKA